MSKIKMKIPYLNHFGSCLNDKVAQTPNVKYAVGRQIQLSSMEQVLLHENKNTPMLVGEAGVGKTDIVEGLAAKLNAGDVPKLLKGYQIWNVNLGYLNNNINPPHDSGYFNSNFQHVIDECKRYNNKIILFIDEFHTIMGASKTSSGEGMDGSQLLKPPLARGEIKLIGATTNDEFYDYVTPDKALMRRLSLINVPEPNTHHTFEILKQNVNVFSQHYGGVTMSDDVLKRIVMLATRYMPHDRYNPDKSFDIMDSTFSEAVVKKQKACTLHDVAIAVYLKTNIPLASIAISLQPQIPHLKQLLQKRVKGQDQAIDTVVRAVDMFFAGLNDPTKPKATFLFLGTTGVGKTELAKALAQALFGDENDMIRLDMASYNTADATEKLLGVNGKRGVLTEQVRRHPYSILLLDEIEKSSPDVWDLLLSILDDGEIQDSRGRTVDFTNLIIILTSNLASEDIRNRRIWESGSSQTPEERRYRSNLFKQRIEDTLEETFRPELVNRFQNIVVFNTLGKRQIVKISRKYIDELLRRLHRQGFDLMFDFNAIDYLTDMGTDLDKGARPLKRVLNHEITSLISEEIVKESANPKINLKDFHTFVLSVEGHRAHKGAPTGHLKADLFGNRQFTCTMRKAPLTEKEKQIRADSFSDKNINKMIKLHRKKPDLKEQIKDRLHEAKLRESQY